MQSDKPLVFRPRKPKMGRAYLYFALFMIPYVLITVFVWYLDLTIAILWTVILVPTVLIVYLVIFRSTRAITYTLRADTLDLRYGRLVNYRIRYTSISDVRRYDLEEKEQPLPAEGPWAKGPGLDTTSHHAFGVGEIKLLATASSGPIVLIETIGGNFGITPADEEAFISALRQRFRWYQS